MTAPSGLRGSQDTFATGPAAPSTRVPADRRWAAWALPVAALWSAGELVAGIAWLRGSGGNPAVPRAGETSGLSVLDLAGPTAGAAALAGAGALGLAVVVAMLVQRRRGGSAAARRVVAGVAVTLGLVLALVLPDYRLLAWVAYLPIIAVMTVAGTMPDGVQVWPWPVVHMALATVGGIAFLVAAREYVRLAAPCTACGRGTGGFAAWAVRHARWAVGVAVAVPVGYAMTRLAWAFGIPFGISRQMLDDISDIAVLGAGLAALGIGGAVLTLGLVQRWGEVFPRWIPGARGRRVPPALAIVPASVVSLLVTSAGLMLLRFWLDGTLGDAVPGGDANVAAWLPEMLWPLWGAALALATYAYAVRRREPCGRCGSR
ncbi:NYN domain-containing protein [Cellulomonas sp. URHE0023]|uniref:NYN domain-containing protein n=1 Tax=Cellulomonas sp. URHE0023 TaxID=1380354 RepID=UPI0012DF2367|nr:NYN domain-containing protein [Cellulomonas sp. URHE0023]